MSRPSSYKPEFADQALKLCRKGFTDKELGEFFGVSEQTINAWKTAKPEFLEALKEGKEFADARVERALFEKATGYSHPDTHFSAYEGHVTQTPMVKVYAPDTTACIFWLKNRKPKDWRDRQEIEATISGPITVTIGGDA